MKAICGSDIGLVRQENQDRVAVEYLNNAVLGVLCDGMGGANCGSDASTLALSTFIKTFKNGYRDYFNSDAIKELLLQSMHEANSIVYSTALNDENKYGMGTTCVATLITNKGYVYTVNVGDSRAYIVTSNSIKQITIDHNYSQYLFSIGEITEEELAFHPDKNMLIRAIGVDDDVQVDYFELMPIFPFKILLCSDGLHGFADMKKVADVLNTTSIEEVPAKLIELANAGGGRDNISVVILQE